MLRKVLTATAALTAVAPTTSLASAQAVRVWVGGYTPFEPTPVQQPIAVLQPPQGVPPPPPVMQVPPSVLVPPVVLPACPTGFATETFLTLLAARHFANAMSRQGYQVRVANHGLRWRVYYGPVVR